ncbi:MAG: lipocalin family protein [Bacteroidota bacterium]|nr:lipocalin family protein [Bacteroidota bacterium]MDP4205710.1 lipocalin family protein [Bacteroidota bacterium]
MKIVFLIFILSLVLCFSCLAKKSKKGIDNSTVKQLDILKYLGTWYEIARFPHKFEKNLQGVTATYTLRSDNKILVLNQGYKNSLDGKLKKAKGIAKIPDHQNLAKLKVSFFLFFYADYYILELDEINYQYALIGSSTPDYLWILSRIPCMSDDIYQMLVDKARGRGYDVRKLILVRQR